MYSLSVMFIKLFSSLKNVRGIYIYLLFLDPEWKIFTVCHLKTWELHMFCFVSVLTVEKEREADRTCVTPDLRSDLWWGHTRSEEWLLMKSHHTKPDLRSDAIIGCLIQSLNVKLITFFNQSQRRADPLTQGTFAMRIIVSYLPLQWIDYQFRNFRYFIFMGNELD